MRAALYGAGVLSALDSRNSSIGLLQATSYISALSGGSWALSSFVFSDMMSIQKLVLGENGSGGWNLDIDLTAPGSNTVENLAFIATLLAELAEKRAAGFPVSLGDFWARVVSHLVQSLRVSRLLTSSVSRSVLIRSSLINSFQVRLQQITSIRSTRPTGMELLSAPLRSCLLIYHINSRFLSYSPLPTLLRIQTTTVHCREFL